MEKVFSFLQRGGRLFEGIPGFRRAPKKRLFILLFSFAVLGLVLGSAAAVNWNLFEDMSVQTFPLLFSGIPDPNAGLFSCFSTLLLHTLLCLLILFFLGMTAFGIFAVPAFLLFKGAVLGIGVLYFLAGQGIGAWASSMLLYTPAAAASLFLTVLFSAEALLFSKSFVIVSHSEEKGNFRFSEFTKIFVVSLILAVAIAVIGCFPILLYSVFYL